MVRLAVVELFAGATVGVLDYAASSQWRSYDGLSRLMRHSPFVAREDEQRTVSLKTHTAVQSWDCRHLHLSRVVDALSWKNTGTEVSLHADRSWST